jgi:transcriptional regulator of arginine metabolism
MNMHRNVYLCHVETVTPFRNSRPGQQPGRSQPGGTPAAALQARSSGDAGDIHELRLVKTPDGYKFPQGEVPDAFLPSIERLIREFVYEVKTAQNLVVVKTSAGSAQPVSAAIDAEEWEEVVGTIGGDDTILVIAPDSATAERLTERIRGYFR